MFNDGKRRVCSDWLVGNTWCSFARLVLRPQEAPNTTRMLNYIFLSLNLYLASLTSVFWAG